MTRRAWLLSTCLAAACLAAACRFAGEDHAGGGSDTEITGIVAARAGSPAADIEVRLVPAGHNPLEEGAYRAVRAARTDGSGKYRFAGMVPGRYRIEAASPADGSRLALPEVEVGAGGLALGPDSLRPPGSLVLPIDAPEAALGGFAYIPGTTYFRPLAAGAERLVLDSLPPGPVAVVMLARGGHLQDTAALARGLVVAAADTLRPGPYSAWARSLRLAVDAAAAGVTAKIWDIPLLVRVGRPDLDFGLALPGGDDVRFTDGDGEPLPFEIASWDSAAGRAEFWVGLDSVSAGGAGFRLHWGNPRAKPGGDGRAVYPSSGTWAGAWHLDPAAGPGASGRSSFQDASEGGNHGQLLGAGPDSTAVAGVAGGAVRLDGKSQGITTALAFDNPAEFTVSLWFRTTTASGGKLLGFGASRLDSSKDFDRHFWMDDSGRVHFGIFQDWKIPHVPEETTLVVSSAAPMNDGRWHFLAAAVSLDGMRVYADGVSLGTVPAANRPAAFTGFWRFGYDNLNAMWPHLPSSHHFAGDLDEIRILHRAVPGEWLRLAFANQSPGSKVIAPAGP